MTTVKTYEPLMLEILDVNLEKGYAGSNEKLDSKQGRWSTDSL